MRPAPAQRCACSSVPGYRPVGPDSRIDGQRANRCCCQITLLLAWETDMAKHSLKVRSRFTLVLVVLVPVLLAVAGAGIHGLQSERSSATELYRNNVLSAEAATDLGASLGDAHAATLELLLDLGNPVATAPVTTGLVSGISNDIEDDIAAIRTNSTDNRAEPAAINVVAAGWTHLQLLRASGGLSRASAASKGVEVGEVEATFDRMTAAATSIVQAEAIQARSAYEKMLSSYTLSVRLMALALVLWLIAAVGMVVWLIRSVLTRTLSYSSFAQAVSGGDYTRRLSPRGDDELDQLGATLDELAAGDKPKMSTTSGRKTSPARCN